MYVLVDLIEDDATRFIRLLNTDTGIVEECFDDSAVVSENNFDFMQKGQKYDCKIKLLGRAVAEGTGDSVDCKVIRERVIIGKKIMTEVQINSGTYYVPQQKVRDYLNGESFGFCFTRKDLIQVDDIIHADLL